MRLARVVLMLLSGFVVQPLVGAELKPETIRAWQNYVGLVEQRIEKELASGNPFLVFERLSAGAQKRAQKELSAGTVFMAKLPAPDLSGPSPGIPSGIVHHWLGAVRIPATAVSQVLAFVQRYDDHSRYWEDVIASKLVSRQGDRFEIYLKLRRKKIVTVTYNTNHTVVYRRHDSVHESSRSVAVRIAEVDNAGESSEREKPLGKDSGYLWRLNSYWRFAQDGDGVIVECESLTLSRGIPMGLAWLIRPMVESVSRESLERTLASLKRGVTLGEKALVQRPKE